MEPYWSNYLKQFDLDSSHFSNIQSNTDKYCVIIEPRAHKFLVPVIKNFMYLLQKKGWGLIIFHGTDNAIFIQSSLQDWKGVHYVQIDKSNLTVKEYNKLLTSSSLWSTLIERFNCQYALIFQTDTLLLKDTVDDFLEYDYIGAPWYKEWIKGIKVGNGGLSLRNTKKMLYICNNYKANDKLNEDIFFSYMCKHCHYKLPTIEQAKEFSVETIYYPTPVAIHKPHLDKFPDPDAFSRMLTKHHLN